MNTDQYDGNATERSAINKDITATISRCLRLNKLSSKDFKYNITEKIPILTSDKMPKIPR